MMDPKKFTVSFRLVGRLVDIFPKTHRWTDEHAYTPTTYYTYCTYSTMWGVFERTCWKH
jgi:hypothetical protein